MASVTVAIGLVVHWHGSFLGETARDIAGDALWAMMMAWWVAALAPATALRIRGVAALGICFVVEESQLLHTPALDAIRRSTVGHLVLGSDFDPRDLAAYACGVLVAVLLDRALLRRRDQDSAVAPIPSDSD